MFENTPFARGTVYQLTSFGQTNMKRGREIRGKVKEKGGKTEDNGKRVK
jgi:hypothetical protein